ncbi:MAG TPA: DUF1579 domain-containing protein, partial [Urbifossiella sp.]
YFSRVPTLGRIPMNVVRSLFAIAFAWTAWAPQAISQEPSKPGPELDVLKKLVGEWDLTMKAGGQEFKGTVTYKMELGGLWLVSNMESELFGQKFYGKGLDSYDAGKKKYTSVWIDSMTSSPMVMEGTYDKEKKIMTMTGDGPGMDGKPMKFKSVSEFVDDKTLNFTMYMGDGKEPAFTIVYKKKK